MMSMMDRVPQPGDKFSVEYQGFRFRILSVKDRQVSKVMMTRIQKAAAGAKVYPAEKTTTTAS